MFRVKIFSMSRSATHGGDVVSLEREINGWLESSQPAIRQMTQSSDASQVIVTFLYEKQRGEDQAHLADADVPDVFERDLDDADLDPVGDEPPTLPEAELPY